MFGEGLAFDEITGNVRITDGVMLPDLKLVGPSARVTITGEAISHARRKSSACECSRRFRPVCRLEPLLLLLANPIVGAAIGAGTLLAQKIMQDPIEQIFSQRYVVWGELVRFPHRSRAVLRRFHDIRSPPHWRERQIMSALAAFRVAAIQTVSGSDVAANLAAIAASRGRCCARQGAQFVLLPEYFGIFGADPD